MMWCTKVIGLVVLLASVLCNAGEIDREESNIRQARGQEHFESVILSEEGGPVSTLFGNCLEAENTMQVSLLSIVIPDTEDEFIRHVPDSNERMMTVDWEMVTKNPKVSSIRDCAAAVHEMNKPMFKYNGGDDCKASKRTYDYLYEPPACEAGGQEAVFILNAPASCPLPAAQMNINSTAGTATCIHFNMDPLDQYGNMDWCIAKGSRPFRQTSTLQYSAIVEFLKGLDAKGMNVSGSDFFIDAFQTKQGVWIWATREKTPINSALLPTSAYNSSSIVIIRGSANFSLQYAAYEHRAASMCVQENVRL